MKIHWTIGCQVCIRPRARPQCMKNAKNIPIQNFSTKIQIQLYEARFARNVSKWEFFSNFEPFCGARLWLGGNNEVEKIRRNLHFAHHTVEQWCYETFSFLLKWWSSQLFLAFFISCIFHWQIVSLYHLYYDIVDQKWNYSKNCLRSKANWNVFLNTYVTRKETFKGISQGTFWGRRHDMTNTFKESEEPRNGLQSIYEI